MSHNGIRGIVKTITDGLKDANMQYDWAIDAKNNGKTELSHMHIAEAKKRLDGAKEWYDKAKTMLHDAEPTELEQMLMCHYKDWYRDLKDKIETFHKA